MTPATILSHDGIEQSVSEWALDYGITPAIIIGRLERGEAIADAITTPMKTGHRGQKLSSPDIEAFIASNASIWRQERRKFLRSKRRSKQPKLKQPKMPKVKEPKPPKPPKPANLPKTYTVAGQTMTVDEWASHIGVTRKTIYNRLSRGLSLAEALSPANKLAATYTFDGRSMSVKEWAAHAGLNAGTLDTRLRRGMSFEEAIAVKRDRFGPDPKLYTIDDDSLSMSEWARKVGCNPSTIYARMKVGMSFEEAITTPRRRRESTPGVPSDLTPSAGTGAGSTSQETPNITFSQEAAE